MQTKQIENSIKLKANNVMASLNSANKERQNIHQTMLNLKNEQVKIYQKIATIYLLESPDNHNAHIQSLINQLQELFSMFNKRSQELDQLMLHSQHNLSSLFARIDELSIQKVRQLENDPEYVTLFNRFKEAEENLNNETINFQQAQHEFSEKLAQYSQNRCYNYLLKRNFGENNYKGFGIFRKLDAWAARCVNFSENYQNQKILKALLKESQSRYDIKKGLYQAALEPKENKERIVENSLHLPQLRSELAQTEQMLAHYKKQKEKNNQDFNDTKLGKSNQFQDISNQLAQFLQRQSQYTLEHLTLQTKSAEDDILLKNLQKADKQIQQLEERLPALQQTIQRLEHTYNRFNQVLYIFSKNNIPSSFYEYDLSPSRLDKILNNLFDENVFPQSIVHALIAYRIRIDRTVSSTTKYRSGWSISNNKKEHSSSWRTSSSSSSRSSSGGGFSSSSSSGGGGFRTTDSF